MQMRTNKEAWEVADMIFPTDYEKDEASSKNAGYPIYKSTAEGNDSWISDLGNRLELNIWKDGYCESTNIWIEEEVDKFESEKAVKKAPAAVVMKHYYSDKWCNTSEARTQEQLQQIAKQIREVCTVVQIHDQPKMYGDGKACTEYQNENLGIRYWIHDNFGHISDITEARSY